MAVTITTQDLGKPCLEEPRWWAAQTRRDDGSYVIGGGNVPDPTFVIDGEQKISSIEIVDPITCESTILPQTLNSPIAGTIAVMTQGQVLFYGGGPDLALQALSIDHQLRSVGQMLFARSGLQPVVFPDGRVWFTGGYNKADRAKDIFSHTEIFTPDQANTPGPDLSVTRAGHTVTLLPNGQVLIVGGKDEKSVHATAELFSPELTPVPLSSTLLVPRRDHRSVLASERVWILGGSDMQGNGIDLVEYFDLNDQQFHVARSASGEELRLAQGRDDFDAVFIPELQIIVMGGGQTKEGQSAAIDVLDLQTMTITSGQSTHARDEAGLAIQEINPAKGTVSFVFLQGMEQAANRQKLTPGAETVTVTVTR